MVIGAAVWLAGPGFFASPTQAPPSGLPPVDYSLGADSQPQPASMPQFADVEGSAEAVG